MVGDFLFWLVIFFGLVCSLIELNRVKWDSLIAKGFIFEVLSQSLKRREAEITINPNARTGEHLIVLIQLLLHGSKLSEFIQSDAPSNTLLLIPNKFGTVFELGIQRLETLKQLEIQYSQAIA